MIGERAAATLSAEESGLESFGGGDIVEKTHCVCVLFDIKAY